MSEFFGDIIEDAISRCTSDFMERLVPHIPMLLNSDGFQRLLIEASDAGVAIMIKPPIANDITAWFICKSFDAEELSEMSLEDQLLMARTYDIYVEMSVKPKKERYIVRCCWGARNEGNVIKYVFLHQLVISKHGHINYLQEEEDSLQTGYYFY